MRISKFTTINFVEPTILDGIAQIFSFGQSVPEHNFVDDKAAIYADWCAIGEDMERAIIEIEARHNVKKIKKKK